MLPWCAGIVRDLACEWVGSEHSTSGIVGASNSAQGALVAVSSGHPIAMFESKLHGQFPPQGTIDCQTTHHQIHIVADESLIRVTVNGGVFMQITRRPTGEIYDGYQQLVGRLVRDQATTLIWGTEPLAFVIKGRFFRRSLPDVRRPRMMENRVSSDHEEMAVFVVALLETVLYSLTA